MRLSLNVDPAKTSCPLDILLAKRLISDAEHQAGLSISAAYRKVHRTHPRAVDMDGSHGGGEPSPEHLRRLLKAETRLGRALKLLKAESRRHYDQVINVAVFERLNFPLVCVTGKHRRRLKTLREGLSILVKGKRLYRNQVYANVGKARSEVAPREVRAG